jgi:hypothetical protein
MIEVYEGDLAPSILDTIKIAGVAQDLTGATVIFRMRAAGDTALLVDQAARPLAPLADGQVRYDWQKGDTDTVGDYLGWWRVTLANANPQDTPEFPIRILEHADDSLAPFATPYDLAARLGVTLTPDEAARADLLLDLASDEVRRVTGQTINYVKDDLLVRPGSWGVRLRLPQRPVIEVTQVTATFYTGDPYVAPPLTYYLDGDELVRFGFPIGLEQYFFTIGNGWLGPAYTLSITYSHGWKTPPAIVKAITIECAVRAWLNPHQTATVTGGIVDQYSPALSIYPTEDEKKILRETFHRRNSGTIALR